MKILHVNSTDIKGGAARAAYRLHKALLFENVDSWMLVQLKYSDDDTILPVNRGLKNFFNKFRHAIDFLPVRFHRNRNKTLFSPSWLGFSNIANKINEINPDIVHLHWICSGTMKIEDLIKIKAPIVWSLHDNWAFTGGCHIMWDCQKYLYGCESCHVLGSKKINDLSKKIFKRKQKVFSKINGMTIVSLSNWLNECSKNSLLLREKKHIFLPNLINSNFFRPCNKKKSRDFWNLPKDKKLVLFGALKATKDVNKGYKKLTEAINKLNKNLNIEFVVFGSGKVKTNFDFGFKSHYIGNISNDENLISLYSAVDVMVVPSLQEAFGQTAVESMACGVPTVAFETTGLLDIVDHKINGYLANPFDTTDLKDGIEWILNNKNYDELCKNARKKVVKEFDSKIVATKYIQLYKKILEVQDNLTSELH